MLPKSKRLTTKEVRQVLATGRSAGRGSSLALKKLDFAGPFRCSAVVSKKVAKSAVKRNSLRRAVYRALEHASLPASGYAILFIQSVPKDRLQETFSADIKKLLHV